MNYNSEKTDKLINYIPIISAIALICFRASNFNLSDPTEIFLNNGLLSLSYPLLFMYLGYKYGYTSKNGSSEKTITSQLKYIGLFYIFVVIATLARSFPSEGFFAFGQIFLILTGGIPTELWFVPAGVLAILAFETLQKKFKTETIIKFSALVFVFSLFITTYGGLPIPFLNTMKYYAESIFIDSHCGVFSAILFISLGVRYSEKATTGKTGKLLFVMCLSFLLMLMEITILSLKANIKYPLFFLATVPATTSIFSLFLKVPDIGKGIDSVANIGAIMLFIGQFLCSICNDITASEGFLFANFFSSTSEKIEVILLISLIVALAVQACSAKERWVDAFAYYTESFIIFILRPFAYIMTAFGTKIKNVIMTISFGVLPILLWFFERGIKHSLCSDIFVYCLIAIILCSLFYPMKVNKKSGVTFSIFLFTAIVIYLSAKLFDVYTYNQTGRMLLFFFLPLTAIVANRKGFLTELLKNYTTGIYLSFVAFISYCLMFRPYDITRYKGAFCNANMCGLYLVVVCTIALCNLPNKFSKKDFSKYFLHWSVFGISFGFIMLTISRTAFVGAVCAIFIKICAMLMQQPMKNKSFLQKAKSIFSTITPVLSVVFIGLTVSYTSVRFIPGIIDQPAYLINEIINQMEYKVFPGASIWDENYISPLRFLQAWANRSLDGYESINDLSTGRITIYLEYLKNLSFTGHMYERMHIEGETLPTLAHNVFLQIAYNCGIFAGLVYITYCIYCLVYGLHRYRKKDDFALCSAITIIAYITCGVFESMEAYYYPLFFAAFIELLPLVCTHNDQCSQNMASSSDSLIEQSAAKQRMQIIIAKIVILVMCAVLIYLIFIASSNPNKYILNGMLK